MATAAPQTAAFKFSVEFEPRDGGGLRAYSKDVPGFVLSNRDCDRVLNGVVPVLETILSEMFNGRVIVKPVVNMRERLEDAGVIERKSRRRKPPEFGLTPRRREYVTELAA